MLARGRRAAPRRASKPLIVARRRHDLRRGHRRARARSPRRRASASPRPRPARARCPYDHPQALGAIGATGTTAANAAAREADVILGVGTRWSDFTTASRSLFSDDACVHQPQRRHRRRVQARRRCRSSPTRGSASRRSPRRSTCTLRHAGQRLGRGRRAGLHARATTPPAQAEVIGVVNRVSGPRDVVVCAAGSMPGDLHKLWRTRDPKGYHVEYGYSTMGYEIAGGLGVKMAAPDREVFVHGRRRLVPDDGPGDRRPPSPRASSSRSSWSRTTATSRSARCRESVGSQRFGTTYRYRGTDEKLPVDLAANAAQPRRARDRHAHDRRVRGRAARGGRVRRHDRRADPHRPARSPRPTPRRGGTCRWRRSPRSTPPAPRASGYERDKATQKTYLKTPRRP